MATGPKWKRVLISGSNLEVNHLTSSTALEPFKLANVPRRLVFASDPGGHFQVTSSIFNSHFTVDTPNLFIRSASVNVPNLPISASTVANPIPSPNATPPLLNFPIVFKEETHGGFEVTSSVAYEPFLGFFASQSTVDVSQMRSGSEAEGPNPGATAPFPPLTLSGITSDFSYALTFTGSFSHTDDNKSFVKASVGDVMEFKRAIPAGQGITASFSLPLLLFPIGADHSPSNPGRFKIVLRHYIAESVLTDLGEFTEQEYVVSMLDPTIAPPGSPQSGLVPSSTSFNNALTGSATGSFVVNGPIQVGDKFQLRYLQGFQSTPRVHVGYRPDGSGNITTPLQFQFSGSSVTPSDTLFGTFSGSFQGNVADNVSSSLTGVTLNDNEGVRRGPGIIMRNPSGTPNLIWNGDSLTTMSIRLHPMNVSGNTGGANINKSGLEVPELTDTQLFSGEVETVSTTTLALADGLPQVGLEFDGDKRRISVDLASNSGLAFASPSGDLKVADTFPGVALSGSFGGALGGAVDINLNPSQSGLQILTAGPGSGLGLKPEVAGQGLNSDSTVVLNELSVDTNFAVTGSGSMTLRALGGPYSLQVAQNLGQIFSSEGNEQTIRYNNHSTETNGALILRKTQPEAITFKNNLIISGNFTVLDSSNVTSINVPDFRTTDPFILLNSGSNSTSPFNNDLGGILVQTSSFAQGVASGSAIFANFKVLGDTIGNGTFLKTGWAVSKGNIPFDATSPVPPFNSTTNLTNKIRTSDFIANLSHLRLSGIGSAGNPESGNLTDTHYGTTTSVDALGSWYVDTGSTATSLGGESNVYLYGIFD